MSLWIDKESGKKVLIKRRTYYLLYIQYIITGEVVAISYENFKKDYSEV